jgi:hypothetical protein
MRQCLLPVVLCALSFGCAPATTDSEGEFTLLLTDAPSDELEAFEVDVSGAVLRRLSGATVAALTTPVRVDFTELEELSDLIVGRPLPGGFYTGMTLTLDFSNAVVRLKGQTSNAAVVDGTGTALTGTVDVEVTFATSARPQVIARRNHLWTLDLDLEQSLTIDSPGNRVVFTPTISATVDPTNPKPARINGALGSVDTTTRTFLVQKLARDNTVVSPYTVRTTATTLFQIDGVVSTGDAGLGALALRAGQAPRVFVQGTIDRNERVLVAAAVETGFGVPGNGQDWIVGHITARTGSAGQDAMLTVLGQSLDVGTTTRRFNTSHTVNVLRGPTKVLKRGLPSVGGTDDLNIGQRVMVFGDLTGTTMNADATNNGIVRMFPTSVFGVATGSVSGNTLTLNVARFDLRPISDFNFTVSSTQEATPATYKVDVTGLTTTGIALNSRIRAIGFVNPVGVPTDADFTAQTLVDRSATGTLMVCQWPANQSIVPTISNGAIAFDVSEATIKAVADGFATILLQNTPTPSITAASATGRGVYSIVEDGGAEVHTLFTSFTSAVAARIAGGARVVRVSAIGTFDVVDQQVSAGLASIRLE